jgi:hypothetical protein
MSRYRSYGQLDDQFVVEGDTFFQRMNARLRPSQLQAGEVALSQNGRMSEDGTWQPRRGLQTLSGAITLDSASLRLPYRIASGSRSNNLVTLVFVDTPSVAFSPGDQVTIAGLTGFTDDPNGTFTIDQVNYASKFIQYTDGGTTDENFTTSATSLATPTTNFPTQLNFTITAGNTANEVYGACVFSDPKSEETDDIIFTATNGVAQALRLRDRVEYKIDYPAGEFLNKRVNMIQAFDKVIIFRDNKTALECTPVLTTLDINSAERTNFTITVTTTDPHGLSADQFVTLRGIGNFSQGGNPNGIYQVEPTNLTATEFEVRFATSDTGTETYSTSGATAEYFNNFQLVPTGDYTLPKVITDIGVSISNSEATFNEPNHGLSVGDELTITNTSSTLTSHIGKKVVISEVVDANTFKFPLSEADATGLTISATKKQFISFLIHQPAAPFGVVNQRRLWMPYFYDSDNSTSPVTWNDRGTRDQIIASDVMDDSTFDVIGSFNITGGSNDFVVGLKPFAGEDTLLVLCRRSVHRLSGASGSLNDVRIDVVTPDLGCAARNTIVQVGNRVLFLSDQGVYALEFLDAYNLRGNEIPLSESVQPYIDRINQRFIDRAVAAFHNNRYYIALPLDNSSENNVLLIYNFINQGWESIDRVDSLEFTIRDMVVGREGERNHLYVTTGEGGVHKIEGFDGGDQISVQAGVSIPETIDVESRLLTREYALGNLDRKVFSRAEVHLKSNADRVSDANLRFQTTDPDNTSDFQLISQSIGGTLPVTEDASIRSRIRLRGYGCSADIRPTQGRPFVRAVKVEGRLTDRSTTSTV